jgi:hypothetical protein
VSHTTHRNERQPRGHRRCVIAREAPIRRLHGTTSGREAAVLTLRSFHLFFISLSIVVTGGLGAWGVTHDYLGLGVLSLLVAVLLVAYEGYFAGKANRIHLE